MYVVCHIYNKLMYTGFGLVISSGMAEIGKYATSVLKGWLSAIKKFVGLIGFTSGIPFSQG